MRLYNTLSRKIEDFKPRHDSKVNMFVCGPTVYDYIHIGNARTFVFFDVVAKWLRYRGYDVTYIQNITDIDNKIIQKALDQNKTTEEIAQEYEMGFFEDMLKLKVNSPSKYPKATEHIPEIVKQIDSLIEKDFAYITDDGIYFDVSKFEDYGQLSGRTMIEAEDGVSRIDESEFKRNQADFVLWKRSKANEPVYAEIANIPGRPGWHIEDTAITEKYFGPQYDLHGAAQDLIFPHHEAEVAQQEAASGKKPFVKYWMHAGFLVNKSQKMSKSLGNFSTARELLSEFSPEVIRFYLLSSHYRSPLDFSDKSLSQAEAAVNRLFEFRTRAMFAQSSQEDPLKESPSETAHAEIPIHTALESIIKALDDDFNIPEAVGILFETVRAVNQQIEVEPLDKKSLDILNKILDIFDDVLGIIPTQTQAVPAEVQKLVDERELARQRQDFVESDRLREQIIRMGYQIDDTPYGSLAKKKRG